MHLYKRRRMWWVEYEVDGVRYRQSTHTRNYAIAEQWVKTISVARNMPTFDEAVNVLKMLYKKPVDGIIPLENAWSQYAALAKAIGKLNIRPKTITDRRNELERLLAWIQKNAATVRTVEAVSGSVAAKYAEYLATGLKKPDGSNLSTKTRQNILGHLSTIWGILEKSSPDLRNPWIRLAPTDTDGKRLDPFTEEQEKRILAAAKKIGKDWFPVCTIARHTGLRYGSVARLTWAEVDMDAGTIHHKPAKTERYDIAVNIPIIEPLRKVLAELPRRGDFLFPLHAELYGKRGKRVQKLLNFREVLTAAGITEKDGNFTFHSWRHTTSTRLSEAKAPKEIRKLILGHTQDATAARYDHDEHLAEQRTALEAAAVTSRKRRAS